MAYSCILVVCLVLCAAQAQPVSQAPVLKEASSEVLFRLQRPFELLCEVEGDASQVKYEWHKDDELLKPSAKVQQKDGKLVFSDPTDEDEGEYRCIASSPAGKASTRPISVNKAYLTAPKVQEQRTKPVEGKPFKLSCAVPDAYPAPSIQWKKNYKDGKTENVMDGRITISPEGDLYFTNATEKDVSKDFKYVCLATSPAVDGEVVLAEHVLSDGLEKNPKPDNEVVQQYVTPDKHTLYAGEQAYLYCIYGGSPQAYPDWYKDGVNVNNKPGDRVTRHNRSKGKRLLIKEVLLEDQGEYTCKINNEVGKEQEYKFNVEVVSAPKFVKKPEKRIQAKEGSNVVIPCSVQAKPASSSQWSFNAALLTNTRATRDEQGLTIAKATKADSGYYGCKVANEHGEDYVETYLQVS